MESLGIVKYLPQSLIKSSKQDKILYGRSTTAYNPSRTTDSRNTE